MNEAWTKYIRTCKKPIIAGYCCARIADHSGPCELSAHDAWEISIRKKNLDTSTRKLRMGTES